MIAVPGPHYSGSRFQKRMTDKRLWGSTVRALGPDISPDTLVLDFPMRLPLDRFYHLKPMAFQIGDQFIKIKIYSVKVNWDSP